MIQVITIKLLLHTQSVNTDGGKYIGNYLTFVLQVIEIEELSRRTVSMIHWNHMRALPIKMLNCKKNYECPNISRINYTNC